jgi:hypothetical protein
MTVFSSVPRPLMCFEMGPPRWEEEPDFCCRLPPMLSFCVMSVKQLEAKHSSHEDPITNPLSPVPTSYGVLQEVTVFTLTNLCSIAFRLKLTQPRMVWRYAVTINISAAWGHAASSSHGFSDTRLYIATATLRHGVRGATGGGGLW